MIRGFQDVTHKSHHQTGTWRVQEELAVSAHHLHQKLGMPNSICSCKLVRTTWTLVTAGPLQLQLLEVGYNCGRLAIARTKLHAVKNSEITRSSHTGHQQEAARGHLVAGTPNRLDVLQPAKHAPRKRTTSPAL